MLDKVLIAEDHETANLSVQKTVQELQIGHIDYVYYCDDALKKIGLAKAKEKPYDLLITDLHFESDGTQQNIKDGTELIAVVRKAYPGVMILVFSAEPRAAVIENLYTTYDIDAYVRKARNDAKELKLALETLSKGQQYRPRSITQWLKGANSFPFTELDISIIRLISQGYQQKQISDHFRQNNVSPSSLSSIEKRLKLIREELGFFKNEQLVLYCKDAGIL